MNKSSKQSKPKASQTSTVKTVTTKVNKTSQQQQQQKKKKAQPNGKAKILSDYAATLNDPFDHPGIPLGFGTMVSTKTATSAYRGTFTTNATDGCFTIFSYPSADLLGVVQILGSGTVPVYANYGLFSDGAVTAAIANFSSARPISHSIRVTPLSSLADKPTQIVSGLIPYSSTGVASGATNDPRTTLMVTPSSTIFASHELKEHVLPSGGQSCVQVNWRPLDVSSFQFTRDLLQFNSAGSTSVLPAQGPVCVITGRGPISLSYAVDIVTRWEGIPNFTGMFSGDNGRHSKMSDYFPSVENLWSSVQDHLNFETFKTAADTISVVYDSWQQASSTSTPKFLMASKHESDEKKEEVVDVSQPASKSPSKSGILSYIS